MVLAGEETRELWLPPEKRPLVGPTPRWYGLYDHPAQRRLWTSYARFNVIEAGRRSGKTELAKRKGVRAALANVKYDDFLVVFAAPTHDQARAIFWEDINKLLNRRLVRYRSESRMVIKLINGSTIQVVGLDKPQRIEGKIVDWIFVDELADMKQGTWERNLKPLLSTRGREGHAWLFGVPRPSAQFKKLVMDAQNPANAAEWMYHFWTSEGVVDPNELESSRRTMDPLFFAQEYMASRVNFAGRAYYTFDRGINAGARLPYNPDDLLFLTFDFNNAPGTAAATQEMPCPPQLKRIDEKFTEWILGCVGEVWIPKHSNSEMVARMCLQKWGEHRGTVSVHGDWTGNQQRSTATRSTEWSVVEHVLREKFGQRLRMNVSAHNPLVRARVNSVNAMFRNALGERRFAVDPIAAPHVVTDFEETMVLEGTDGELDKDTDSTLTHLSDGLGYLIYQKWPVEGGSKTEVLEF